MFTLEPRVKTHKCAIITDQDAMVDMVFVDMTKADVEEMLLSLCEDDLEHYIQETQMVEYNDDPDQWAPDFWIEMTEGQRLINCGYTYAPILYVDGKEF